MRCLSTAAIVFVLVLGAAGSCKGGLMPTFSDRAAFNAQGTVGITYDFEDAGAPDGDGFYFPPALWTTPGVTYNGAMNMVVWPACPYYSPSSNVFADFYGTISGSLNTSVAVNMLGMDVAASRHGRQLYGFADYESESDRLSGHLVESPGCLGWSEFLRVRDGYAKRILYGLRCPIRTGQARQCASHDRQRNAGRCP